RVCLPEIDRALQHTDAIVAILSPDYLAAPYTRREWSGTLAKDSCSRQTGALAHPGPRVRAWRSLQSLAHHRAGDCAGVAGARKPVRSDAARRRRELSSQIAVAGSIFLLGDL